MKKKVVVVISALLFIASYFVNGITMVDSSVSTANCVYSVACLAVFAIVLALCRNEKRVLVGSCVYWGIALVAAVLTVISILTQAQYGALWIAVIVCMAPYYGISGFFRDAAFASQPMNAAYEASLLIIPLVFIVLISVFLFRDKKNGTLSVDTSVPFIER